MPDVVRGHRVHGYDRVAVAFLLDEFYMSDPCEHQTF